jgi:NAD(P)-dependent dehydrogenase (short-subunit alcohol dehydrogenase family)
MLELPALFDLSGKVAVITGASRGIGATIAHAYAAAGAAVLLCSRKQAGVDRVAAEIEAAGGTARAVAAHTGSADALQEVMAAAVTTFGGIDILVNNAATNPHFGPLLEATESEWDKTLDVNVKGYVRAIQAAVPHMRDRGGGKIINVASIAGKIPQPGIGLYAVSKAAVLMLTQTLAAELAPDNIQVNALAPGYVRTRFSQGIWENPVRSAELFRQIPQQRVGEATELAGMALYLAAPASSFTTGAIFVVDGGQLVGSGQPFSS